MGTLGSVATAISRRLLDENQTAVSTVEVREAINEAIKKWKVKRFWFNTGEAVLDIQEGDSLLDLPSDFLFPIPRNSFTVLFSNYTYGVKKVSPVIFDALNSSSITGRPQQYVIRDGQINFQPTANQEYPGTFYYVRDYTAFATDGTQDTLTNDFIDNAEMLIRAEALAQLHGEIRQDEKMEERYTNRANVEYNALRVRTANEYRTGTLTIEQ